ncbi:hypothetical protein [Aliicoccus persicus]|uniref:Outer membrane lipoprotein-sorting protein n=1 Tax=Aliicoccus persicus TaxID=930138 RepID=A0A662Z2S7_9STAP|nr:hypothetical protein [Aliicoccus persicus]SEV93816.1 hypothetical protein SAMN05192557_0885 [Aliicoccus persicus]
MKLLKTGIGLSLMSVLALNVNGENVAFAQDDEDNSDADTEEVEEETETQDVEDDTETQEESSEVNTDEAIDFETLIENGYAAQDEIENLYLETAISVTVADVDNESLTREWYQNDGDVVLSRTEMENPDGSLTIMVNNGEEMLVYTEGQEQAFRIPISVSEEDDAAEGEEDTETEDESGIDAPETEMESTAITASQYLETLATTYDITVEGTQQVGDRDAYKVNLEPIEDAEGAEFASPTTMWIDTEYYIILKQEIDDGSDSVIGSEYVTLEMNEEEFEESLFELELPEGVEIQDGVESLEPTDGEGTEIEDSEENDESDEEDAK